MARFFKFLIVISTTIVVYTANADNGPNHASSYLLKPTGTYSVGYQDISLINTNICPDKFYNKNKNDFSPANKKYCHEIMLRIYYPSFGKPILGNKYSAPFMLDWINWQKTQNLLSPDDVKKLKSILNVRTYNHANTKPITNKKFPIIIFMPGSGQPVQTYTNIVSSLASHGYIVIGINSLFINGAIQISNWHIVPPPKAYFDSNGQAVNLSDIRFVLSNLIKIKYKHDLAKSMNFKSISLIGHSRGAMTIVHFLKQSKKNYIKSIILMDPENIRGQTKYPLPKFSIPTMTIWSSYYKNSRHATVMLSKNDYETILEPNIKNPAYSNHENFSDFSTLQYHPAFQIPKIQKFLTTPDNEQVGICNGYEIAKLINKHILVFLNTYLK